jgi:CRP-like cAMP-binding protein
MGLIRDLRKIGMMRRLSDAHWHDLMLRCTEIRCYPARTLVTRQGAPVSESLMLTRGLMGRHVPARDRTARQMVAIEVPGDFVDLHGFPTGRLDHDVTAITDVEVAVFPHAGLHEIVRDAPALTLALWGLTVVDGAIHRHWSFRIGALRALSSIANFLCEMGLRLRLAGEGAEDRFPLPLTQADIGEACGLTSVHVSRMLRDLREAGLCTVEAGIVTVHDAEGLRDLARFDPHFLHLGDADMPLQLSPEQASKVILDEISPGRRPDGEG